MKQDKVYKKTNAFFNWLRAHRAIRVVFTVVAALALAAFFLLVALNLTVWGSTRDRILDAESLVSGETDFDCILILGAGVRPGGEPSAMLEDRLKTGIELYFSGVSDRILMSGDHMSVDYDEVGVMKRYATEAGVPGSAVFLDHAGLSTYESMWRAKEIFGAERVLVVTQGYHLYRALYVAEALGLEANGVAADLRPYRNQLMREVREMAARAKDIVFALVRPQPTHGGETVDLSGDGDSTNVNLLLPTEQ